MLDISTRLYGTVSGHRLDIEAYSFKAIVVPKMGIPGEDIIDCAPGSRIIEGGYCVVENEDEEKYEAYLNLNPNERVIIGIGYSHSKELTLRAESDFITFAKTGLEVFPIVEEFEGECSVIVLNKSQATIKINIGDKLGKLYVQS
jgi:hypothetical protein